MDIGSVLRFRELIPLFRDIPDKIYFGLDLSGFFLPVGEIARLRSDLEKALTHYVVSYKADIFNLDVDARKHLCAVVGGANLNSEQLKLLGEYEKLAKPYGATFVVYQKPLKLIRIENSALYKEYLRMGLL